MEDYEDKQYFSELMNHWRERHSHELKMKLGNCRIIGLETREGCLELDENVDGVWMYLWGLNGAIYNVIFTEHAALLYFMRLFIYLHALQCLFLLFWALMDINISEI